jgi:predicted ArsR family transcriptional regulator
VTTRDSILDIVRVKPTTISELCIALGVTRNAINVQIKQLESMGVIRPVEIERCGKRGKPSIRYEAAPGSEDLHSKAYPLFLATLLKTLQEMYGLDVVNKVLEQTGRNMAKEANLSNPVSFEHGLKAAMMAADSIGATTEAIEQEGGILVRNYSCPMGTAVRNESCVCKALSAFFSEATNSTVTEKCIRGDRLICQYLVERPPSASS